MEFKGNKSHEDIKAKALHWDQSGWDNGEDWINITFMILGREYHVLYNGFNGSFIAEVDEQLITEGSTELDDQHWYIALLNLMYKTAL